MAYLWDKPASYKPKKAKPKKHGASRTKTVPKIKAGSERAKYPGTMKLGTIHSKKTAKPKVRRRKRK